MMGKDEHKKSRGKRALAQTPQNEKTTSTDMDIEISEEFTSVNSDPTHHSKIMSRVRDLERQSRK